MLSFFFCASTAARACPASPVCGKRDSSRAYSWIAPAAKAGQITDDEAQSLIAKATARSTDFATLEPPADQPPADPPAESNGHREPVGASA